MATYMLCGFANLASIGIQVGGIGIIAPKIRKTLTELGFKAMIQEPSFRCPQPLPALS